MNRSVRMRRACMWLLAALLPILMSACSTVGSSSGSPVSLDDRPSMNCDELSAAVIERARSGDTAGFINQQIDQLSKNCPDEYNIAIDYMSTAAIASNWDIRPCDDLEADGLHPEAIRLLYADGLCTSEPLHRGAVLARERTRLERGCRLRGHLSARLRPTDECHSYR